VRDVLSVWPKYHDAAAEFDPEMANLEFE